MTEQQLATTPTPTTPDPVESAKAAGLRYVTDEMPGIRRKQHRSGFRYVDATGRPVKDPKTLERIKKLAIPPAWTDVWICTRPNGHLQATGRDAKGRKQYRYHEQWRSQRDENKYDRMLAFGAALPAIRQRVDQDLSLRGLPRAKVLAAVVRLLETTLIRIGNVEYARSNRSFGLTTLRDRHVKVEGSTLQFQFRGKSGKDHSIELTDRRLATIVKRCRDLPGQDLFQYIDDEGQHQTIGSADVNGYLREITGQDFTAKDFRTWGGTVLACAVLAECGPIETESDAKKQVVRAMECVAGQLGNTPTICRKSYVHPAIINAFMDGTIATTLESLAQVSSLPELDGLEPPEQHVLHLLGSAASALASGAD